MLGKNRRQKEEKGTPNMRLIDSLKEAMGMSLQELSRAIADRTLWTSFIHRGQGVRVGSTAHVIHLLFYERDNDGKDVVLSQKELPL